jgi:hypothetical protein
MQSVYALLHPSVHKKSHPEHSAAAGWEIARENMKRARIMRASFMSRAPVCILPILPTIFSNIKR